MCVEIFFLNFAFIFCCELEVNERKPLSANIQVLHIWLVGVGVNKVVNNIALDKYGT